MLSEIILAFFAVVGLTFIGIGVFEVFYYRNRSYYLPMIVDLRDKNQDEAWELLEAISLLRRQKSGQAVIQELFLIFAPDHPELSEEKLYHYLRAFDLPGTVFCDGDTAWMAPYQKTPVREGTKSS